MTKMKRIFFRFAEYKIQGRQNYCFENMNCRRWRKTSTKSKMYVIFVVFVTSKLSNAVDDNDVFSARVREKWLEVFSVFEHENIAQNSVVITNNLGHLELSLHTV